MITSPNVYSAIPVGNPPAREIVGTEFNGHLVAHQNLDKVFSNLAANGGQDGCLCIGGTVNDASKHGVGETLQNDTFNFNHIILDFLDTLRLVLSVVASFSRFFLSE